MRTTQLKIDKDLKSHCMNKIHMKQCSMSSGAGESTIMIAPWKG